MFNRGEISNLVPNVQHKKSTIHDINDKWNSGKIKLPPLQRRFSYGDIQRCNVIASILAGLSIDSLSVVRDGEDPTVWWLCDGNHRLRSILDFIDNKFPLDTQGGKDNLLVSFFKTEKFKKEYNKKFFKDLPKDTQNYILHDYDLEIVETVCNKEDIEVLIDAIIRSKNTCSAPMNKERLSLGSYLLGYSMRHNTDIRTECYVHFMDTFELSFSGEKKIEESQKNSILNNRTISETLRILMSSLIEDADVEKFIFNTCRLGKELSYSFYRGTRSYFKNKNDKKCTTPNAICGWVKHLLLCGYLLTVLKNNLVDEKDVLYNLAWWDKTWKFKSDKLSEPGSTSQHPSTCWKIILFNYSDKIDFNRIVIADTFKRNSNQVLATRYLARLYKHVNQHLLKEDLLRGNFSKSYFSNFFSFFLETPQAT